MESGHRGLTVVMESEHGGLAVVGLYGKWIWGGGGVVVYGK